MVLRFRAALERKEGGEKSVSMQPSGSVRLRRCRAQKVFNCGHRMEVYVSPSDAEAVIAAAKKFGARAVGI